MWSFYWITRIPEFKHILISTVCVWNQTISSLFHYLFCDYMSEQRSTWCPAQLSAAFGFSLLVLPLSLAFVAVVCTMRWLFASRALPALRSRFSWLWWCGRREILAHDCSASISCWILGRSAVGTTAPATYIYIYIYTDNLTTLFTKNTAHNECEQNISEQSIAYCVRNGSPSPANVVRKLTSDAVRNTRYWGKARSSRAPLRLAVAVRTLFFIIYSTLIYRLKFEQSYSILR